MALQLDIRSIFIVAVVAEVLRATLFATVWSLRRIDAALAYWSLASLFMAVGLLGIALRGEVPVWCSIGLAHAFVYSGVGLRWCGMRRFAGQQVRLGWCLGPPLVLGLLLGFHERLHLDVNARTVMSGGVDLFFYLLMWRDLRFAQRREWLAMRRVVIVILCVHVPIEGIRTLQAAMGGLSPTQYLDPNALQAVLLLGILSLYVLLDLSAFMMLFERHENRLLLAATLDSLTGLLNRSGFLQLAERQRQRSERDGEPVSVLVMDLDLFKNINDTYGHEAGDAAICAFARCARAALRPTDLLSRPGGEEFWALLPNTALDEAGRIAQRICDQFRGAPMIFEGRTIAMTVSLGVAQVVSESESVRSALARADQALYVAKREGRNRVSTAVRAELPAQAMQSG